jgi:1-acyl-sn-glycerol-3-phosphate acyltransferase
MTTISAEVQGYVERQPRLAWRRHIMRGAIRSVLFHIACRVRVYGEENVPDAGPGIVMINHISLLDPVLCMGAVNNRFVIPMTKVENMSNPVIGPLVRWWGSYSVNRGEVDRKALANSIELVRSGQLILISPEGTRNRTGLGTPKDGLAYIATKANAVIVPAAIIGADRWEKRVFTLQRPRISVTFGRPFRFAAPAEGRIPRETLAAMTTEAMYQLALAIPQQHEAMRGAYRDVENATTQHLVFVDPRTGTAQ